MYTARIITVTNFASITDDLLPFVHFKANIDKIELKDTDKVIILQIEGTDSYIPIFPNKVKSLEDLEKELKKQDAKLNSDTRIIIEKHLNND